MFEFSEKSIETLSQVDERLGLIFKEAIKISPIDFGIPKDGGFRTAEEQNKLYLEGKSKCDGYNTISKHQTGLACDFYAYVDEQASWDKVHLAMIAAIILSVANRLNINIRWGGTFNSTTFKGWDYPHIEIME